MKILALHGYMQNATIMRSKMQKLFGATATNIVCPEGSYMITEGQYGWWPLASKVMFNKPHSYTDMNDFFLPFTEGWYGQDKEYDIVVGFSQGAVAATILLAQGLIDAQLIVLMSGSDIMDIRFIPEESIDIKALGIVGETDSLCSIDDTKQLLSHYATSTIISHKHGHVIPTSKIIRDAIRNACISA